MTDRIDVAALRALLDKATPGPWACHDGPSVYQHRISSHRLSPAVCDVFRSGDAALIAAAVNALPELLRVYQAVADAPEGVIFNVESFLGAGEQARVDFNSEPGLIVGQRVRLVPSSGGGGVMCTLDYDRPDFYLAKTHRARRIHKCEECRRLIQKGERYVRSSGKWDGHISEFKHCLHCDVLVKWLQRECGGFMHGGIMDEVEEHIGEYRVPAVGFSLARLYVSARDGWARRGRLLPVPQLPTKSLHGATP